MDLKLAIRLAIVGNSAQSLLNFRRGVIEQAVRSGHEVFAYAPDFNDESREAVVRLGGTPRNFYLSRSSKNPLSDLRCFFSLRSKFAVDRPDSVLCYFVKPSIYGVLAAKSSGVMRRIAMLEGLGHGFTDDNLGMHSRLLGKGIQLLLRFALRKTDKTLVLNQDDFHVIRDVVGVTRVQNVGGIGVDLERFEPAPLSSGPTTFIMAARLIKEKGVLQFVEAARDFRGNPNVRFVLLGDVDDNPNSISRSELNRWVEEEIIEWPGHVTDVAGWIAKSHVFVLPSYYREGVPRSIQEAMALGRPIITTDSVGCRDTVIHGVNGFLIPPRNVESLVSAMDYFVSNRYMLGAMGRASRSLAEERYDAKKFDRMLLDYLTRSVV